MTSRPRSQACAWALALGGSLVLAAPANAADGATSATSAATSADTSAAAPATAASGPVRLPKDRCPVMPVPAFRGAMPDGEHLVNARFILKADGSLSQIRVEGRAPRPFVRAVEEAVHGYQCLPGETDLDIATEFRLKITTSR